MKKAYVKPVFLAEEFVGVSHVASACQWSKANPAVLYDGVQLCTGEDHKLQYKDGQTQHGYVNGTYSDLNMSYWDYAGGDSNKANSDAYLFTTDNGTCDFLWDSNNDIIGVWTTADPDGKGKVVRDESTMIDSSGNPLVNWLKVDNLWMTFTMFFFGNKSDHKPGYEKKLLMS